MANIFQTLDGFIKNPFNKEITDDRPKEFEQMYQTFKLNNKIQVVSIYNNKDVYMIHLKIPSETFAKNFYDVVIQFTPADENVTKSLNIENYFVKFFSNSPSFVYKYSALYFANDMLVDALLDFYNKEALSKMPENTNKNMELFYDKSIYIASRFLLDHKKQYMTKLNFSFKRTTNFNRFLKAIQDTETISLNANVAKVERNVNKAISKNKTDAKQGKSNNAKRASDEHLKRNKSNVSKNGKVGKIGKVGKVKSVKSTVRKK